MKEDDAPTIWKTPAKDERRLPEAKHLVHPHFPMGTDI